MTTEKKVLIIGELHQDLFYKTSFFTELAGVLSKRLTEGTSNNSITIDREKLKNEILKIIDDFPKKIPAETYIKRGGNGNNSAMLLHNLEIPVKIMTTIGKGHEWIIPELKELGIDTSSIYMTDERGPISTIIEDPNITKIFVAPNLKRFMNFEKIDIPNSEYESAKIVFITPLAAKYTEQLKQASALDVITATTIETQKISDRNMLEECYIAKTDILFANLNDLGIIYGLDISDNSETAVKNRLKIIDNHMKEYAHARIYTLGRYGAWICVDQGINASQDTKYTFRNVPIISVEVKNRTGAGDTFAAGFIAYIYTNIEDKRQYRDLTPKERMDLLLKAAEYARAAAALKISTGDSPNRKELEDFYRDHKLF